MLNIYTPHVLARVMFDERQTVSTNAWLTRFFPGSFMSDQAEIMFDELDASRPIAPFMIPTATGKPIYRREGERVRSFRPAYTKPKDVLRPTSGLQRQPGELVGRMGMMSPSERIAAETVRITQFHRNAIQRLWDYMGARSLIDGFIDIPYATDDGTPAKTVRVDFERDANHTVTKTAGNFWGDAGVSIFDDIQGWVDDVSNAKFGGSVQDVMLGSEAAATFMADEGIKAKLNMDLRGTQSVYVEQGIIRTDPMNPFTYLGTLGSGVNVWRVAGPGNNFESHDKSQRAILGPKQVLLVSNGVQGIKAFGAILDIDYDLAVAEIFSKMWNENDPSGRVIMSQSAPLMIPVNPNCTLLANVLP